MESCRTDAIGAVNSFIRQTKSDTAIEGRISLIIFDSQGIDVIRDGAPAASCAEVTPDEYQPRASTPLLDAVGHGVALLDKAHSKDERCVLAVMTDGLENASREYTRETIKALLDRKQKEDGWLVVYLGADHNAWSQASQLGFAAGNVAAYDKSATGDVMFAVGARVARYSAAPSPHAEAASGGFTADERDSLQGGASKARRKSKA